MAKFTILINVYLDNDNVVYSEKEYRQAIKDRYEGILSSDYDRDEYFNDFADEVLDFEYGIGAAVLFFAEGEKRAEILEKFHNWLMDECEGWCEDNYTRHIVEHEIEIDENGVPTNAII